MIVGNISLSKWSPAIPSGIKKITRATNIHLQCWVYPMIYTCEMFHYGYVNHHQWIYIIFYPCSSGLLHWHWGNHVIRPIPEKQPWKIWVKMISTKTQQKSNRVHNSLKRKCPSFWQNFNHWLHWKLSFEKLPVQPVMKISSKWRHFYFSNSWDGYIWGVRQKVSKTCREK